MANHVHLLETVPLLKGNNHVFSVASVYLVVGVTVVGEVDFDNWVDGPLFDRPHQVNRPLLSDVSADDRLGYPGFLRRFGNVIFGVGAGAKAVEKERGRR